MERTVQDPVRPDVPDHPLTAARGPAEAARDAARVGLYVHVPFCAVECPYCHFSKGRLAAPAVERWLAGLEREADLRAPVAGGATFTSVFFGGGTPSTLAPDAFARLARSLRSRFTIACDAEITLEANPESVRPARLAAWAAAGVNRLSVGAQSFDAGELGTLGRAHGSARPAEAFALARAHGFERLSLDLMYGFPGHRPATWQRTLEAALALAPEHVSFYCYIAEPGTPMGERVRAGALATPSPDAQAELYAQALARLGAADLALYETSNACRPLAEARHNLVYWLRRDYLGLGPSAHSLWRGERWGNAYALDDWAGRLERGEDPASERERETACSVADEVVLLGLRLDAGLAARDHAPSAWRDVERRFGAAFDAALAHGRLERTAGGWRIPDAHRFVADDTIAWLAARARPLVDSDSERSLESSSPCPAPLYPAA